jgi:DNA-binding Lrp family transcriptional regulator
MESIEYSRIITDQYNAKILTATYKKPKSVLELSSQFGIPIAACYRRVKLLEENGLLERSSKKTDWKGKRISLYKSQIPRIRIVYENGALMTKIPTKGHSKSKPTRSGKV